jgi:hypothetical protein
MAQRKEYFKAYYQANKERWKTYNLNNVYIPRFETKYGITISDYAVILDKQGSVCKICGGVNSNGKKLSVDHDHVTGKVRGLLCYKCNTMLGLCNDNKDIIKRMLEYLE